MKSPSGCCIRNRHQHLCLDTEAGIQKMFHELIIQLEGPNTYNDEQGFVYGSQACYLIWGCETLWGSFIMEITSRESKCFREVYPPVTI